MSYKWIFTILKIIKVKPSFLAVKRIEQSFEIKGTLNRKVRSGRPRSSTIKDDYRLKMTILKGIWKQLFSTTKIQNSKKKLPS